MSANVLANALATSLRYLQARRDDEHDEDDDIRVLEDVAACLQDATPIELNTITAALRHLGADHLIEGLNLEKPT